ncbi:hypothetical protein [Acerihabitans arboris]|uniref:Uncharacterized protein n=1 Tax=Acerihabitans arboris TaxID=2691583 RepID=A0A845SS39_9GAMM|nr:hypothetical protein [Acerihabitans arboris]NDL65907.1 hypothetical protein [Acerihabitans arboris]
MKVICKAIKLTSSQKKIMGVNENSDYEYPFEIGESYTVLGISSQVGRQAATILQMPYFYAFPAPLCLFEIIDSRPSAYWVIKALSEYELALWPKEFYQPFFHDQLSDLSPEYVEIYKEVVERLENEFS